MKTRYASGRSLAAALLFTALLPSTAQAGRWADFQRRVSGAWGAVKDEVSLWPSMAYHFPSAYLETARDGSQINNLVNTGRAVGGAVAEEARFAPQWLPNLPGAYVETAADGRQLSSLRGGVTGFTDRSTLGLGRIDTTPYANTPEHRQAWEGGRNVGEATSDEMLLTLGTAGLARGGSLALRQGQRGLNYARNGWNGFRGVRPPPGPSNSRFLHQQYLDELATRQRLSQQAGSDRVLPSELQSMRTRQVRPGDLRYSQSTVQPNVRDIEGSMRMSGWQGDAIDVVRMPDGRLTALDNRRLMAAQQAGLDRIPVRVHSPRARMPEAWRNIREAGADTFGDAVRLRTGRQGAGFPRNGNFTQPGVTIDAPPIGAAYDGLRMPIRPTTSWTNAAGGAVLLDSAQRITPEPVNPASGPGLFGLSGTGAGPGAGNVTGTGSGSWLQPQEQPTVPGGF